MSYAISLSGTTVTIASPGPRGVGLPSGGSAGQVLSKASSTEFDIEWVDEALPSGGTTGQILVKASSTDGDTNWETLDPIQERRYSKNLDIIAEQMVRQRASLLFLGDSINNPTQDGYMRYGYSTSWNPDYWRGISPGHSNGNASDNGWLLTAAAGSNITGLAAANGPDPNLPGLDSAFVGRQAYPGSGGWYNQTDNTGGNTTATAAFEMASIQPSSSFTASLWLGDKQGTGIENTFYDSEKYTMRTLWYAKSATDIFADYRGASFSVATTESISLDAGWNLVEKEIGTASYVTPQYAATKFYSSMAASTDSAQLVASYVFSSEYDGMSMAFMGGGGWATANHRYADDTAPTVAGSGNRSCWYLDETAEQIMTMMDTDIVVIQTGANDNTLADHTDHLAAVIDRFRSIRPGVRFLIISQYWLADNARWAQQAAFQRALAGSPGYRDVAFLDLYQMVVDNVADFATFDSTYLSDGVHPNNAGSSFMAGLEWSEIAEAAGIIDTVAEIVEDTTPQLGGDLDVNGNAIVSVSNGDIAITPDGTGAVVLDGLSWPTADGSTGQYLKTDGAGSLTFGDVAATLNDLTDVSVGSEQASDVLVYRSGSGWINDALDYTEITSNVGSGAVDLPTRTDITAGSITDVVAMSSDDYQDIVDNGTPDPNTLYVITGAATSIADADDVTITSAATNDFLVVDASGDWVDKTPAQVRGILDLEIGTDVQAYSDDLASLASLTTASDRLPYFSGAKTASLATFTAFGRSLVDDADAAAGRTTLGLGTAATSASTDFVAASAVSTFGGTLIDDADAATARTTLGLGTASTSDTGDFIASSAASAFGLTLLDDTDAATARSTLGLVIDTDVQAYDAELAAIAGLTSAAGKAIEFTGSGTAATFDITTAGKALLDDADASAQRTTLGLGTLATASTITDSYVGHIEAPADGTYYLDPKVAEAREITGVYFAWTAGGSPDGDIDVQIGGTSVLSATGRMNSGTTFTGTIKTDGTEDVAADAVITVVLGGTNGVADITDLRFAVEYTQ